jgi:hypothetical protein
VVTLLCKQGKRFFRWQQVTAGAGSGAEKTYWNSLLEQTSEKKQPVGLSIKGSKSLTTLFKKNNVYVIKL